MKRNKLFDEVLKEAHLSENEIPNEETVKAMKDEELFTANSAEEMIRDCIGDPNWMPNSR